MKIAGVRITGSNFFVTADSINGSDEYFWCAARHSRELLSELLQGFRGSDTCLLRTLFDAGKAQYAQFFFGLIAFFEIYGAGRTDFLAATAFYADFMSRFDGGVIDVFAFGQRKSARQFELGHCSFRAERLNFFVDFAAKVTRGLLIVIVWPPFCDLAFVIRIGVLADEGCGSHGEQSGSAGEFPQIDESVIIIAVAVDGDEYRRVIGEFYLAQALQGHGRQHAGINRGGDHHQVFGLDFDYRISVFGVGEVVFDDFKRVDADAGSYFADDFAGGTGR